MNKSQELKNKLLGLRQFLPEVRGAVLSSMNGFVIAYEGLTDSESPKVGAMAVATFAVSKRVTEELGIGNVNEIVIRTERGFLLIYEVKDVGILAVETSGNANVGLVNIMVNQLINNIKQILNF